MLCESGRIQSEARLDAWGDGAQRNAQRRLFQVCICKDLRYTINDFLRRLSRYWGGVCRGSWVLACREAVTTWDVIEVNANVEPMSSNPVLNEADDEFLSRLHEVILDLNVYFDPRTYADIPSLL